MKKPSLSARRAWIEIVVEYKKAKEKAVALRKESVDRNIFIRSFMLFLLQVALRKESVDRNCHNLPVCPIIAVALRKESVDRNLLASPFIVIFGGRSPQGERG